jgi:hypothetical protein
MIMANARFKIRTLRTACSETSSRQQIPPPHAPSAPRFDEARVCRIDRRLIAIDSELSEITYRLALIDYRLSAFSCG